MHRELQQPSMFNNPNAPIKLRIELNMDTEKAVNYLFTICIYNLYL